ncbi:MAG: hypothetical protein R3E58_20885 [Phycisphaerae bacterium]
MGIINLGDIEEVGVEPLVSELELEEELAKRVVESAKAAAQRYAVEEQAAKELAAAAEAERTHDAPAAGDAEVAVMQPTDWRQVSCRQLASLLKTRLKAKHRWAKNRWLSVLNKRIVAPGVRQLWRPPVDHGSDGEVFWLKKCVPSREGIERHK